MRFETSLDGTQHAQPHDGLLQGDPRRRQDRPVPRVDRHLARPPVRRPGRTENGLTGTLFKAINPNDAVDFAIKVPYAYSRLRLWRNTSIANLAVGTKATLAPRTLGYEWNTDEVNGVRPAGLIRLSETTEIADAGAAGQRRHLHHGRRSPTT